MFWQKGKKLVFWFLSICLFKCVKARVKALGYGKEGDRRKQPWSTELINSEKICICNREKNLSFRSSKVLSVFSCFLRNILSVFFLIVFFFSYQKLCLFIKLVIRLIYPTSSKKLSKWFWYVKGEINAKTLSFIFSSVCLTAQTSSCTAMQLKVLKDKYIGSFGYFCILVFSFVMWKKAV